MANSRTATYRGRISWLGDGAYDGDQDDVSADMRAVPGIAISRGKDSARARSGPMIASASLTLSNSDALYSPERADSPLYQLADLPDRPIILDMQVGREVGIDAADVGIDDIDTYVDGSPVLRLLTGLTEEPQQLPSRLERAVRYGILGSMASLRGTKVSTTLYTNIRTDTAVGHVLDAAGWPAADRVISTGDTTLLYWWLDDVDAWDALSALLESEGAGAALYEDTQGRVVFENRNYRASADRSSTAQALFRDRSAADVSIDAGEVGVDDVDTLVDGGGALTFVGFDYGSNRRDLANEVSHTVYRRVAQTSAAVWQYGTSLVLAASEAKTIFARSSTGDPLTSVQDVTVTTDYVVSAGSLASVVTSVISATVVAITFTAGGSGATVLGPASAATGPQLRAQALPVVSSERVEQTASGSTFLTTTHTLNLGDTGASHEMTAASALALVNAAAEYYRDPRALVTIEIVNGAWEMLDQIGRLEVSDRIAIVEDHTGTASDFWVEQIRHQVTLGQRPLHRCVLVCAKALDTFTPGLWDAGLWNTALRAN